MILFSKIFFIKIKNKLFLQTICENSLFFYFVIIFLLIGRKNSLKLKKI
ncbi:hypothetical protein CU024_0785 [Enterococcus faecium]|nr:hypothetical protein EfmE1039_2093 [Enterococcus faecium E1039]MBK4753648.1 hypothetical protein [Enterococcus faecium]MBK4757295.1 hypothetical protein [Enterococcus faecium]MBK4763425.1 hypothetical protein [Enterococcus faecium]MBK4777314.1 hypothetical protein [Enterococcus faecium]